MHELVHGLGFSIYNFRERKNAAGTIDSMVQERAVAGDSMPVWYVTSSRTLQVARGYFGCQSMTGVPLMGENQLGPGSRGSHWETRIMNDEFMAYGEGSKVSALTIAMMEDLGFYLGNYNNSQCMYWGKSQGCDFVNTRCATRSTTEQSISLQVGDHCNKPYMYAGGAQNGLKQSAAGGCRYLWENPILTTHCAPPGCTRQWPGMASDSANSGRPDWACDSSTHKNYKCTSTPCTCSAECQRATTEEFGGHQTGSLIGTDTSGSSCKPALGPVSAAGRANSGLLGDNPLQDYPLIFAIGGACAIFFFISAVCSCIKGQKFRCLVMTSLLINIVFCIAGIAALSALIYAYFFFEELDGIVSQDAWMMMIGVAIGMLFFAVFGILVVCCVKIHKGCCKHCKLGLFVFLLLLFCIILVQTLGTVSHSCACVIGLPCLRNCVHGAPLGDLLRVGVRLLRPLHQWGVLHNAGAAGPGDPHDHSLRPRGDREPGVSILESVHVD
jgi:hypothetical protein